MTTTTALQRAREFIRRNDEITIGLFRRALDGMLIEDTKDVAFAFGETIAANEASLLIYKLPLDARNTGASVTFPDDSLPTSTATFQIERRAWDANTSSWGAWTALFAAPISVATGQPSNTSDAMWTIREVSRFDLFRAVCLDAGGGGNATVLLHLQLLTKLRER